MIVQYYDNISIQMSENKVDLVSSIWFVRKTALAVCFVTLLYTYWSYRDEHFENFKVLRRIENRLNSLENMTPILESSAIRKLLCFVKNIFIYLFIANQFLYFLGYSKRLALKRAKNFTDLPENHSDEIVNNSIDKE